MQFYTGFIVCTFQSKKGGKDQRNRYSTVPHLTQDTTWESDKITIKHHKQMRRAQPFSSQRWTDTKVWQTQDINNTNDQQKKYRLGTVCKNILLEGLNRFHGANLDPRSGVYQDA